MEDESRRSSQLVSVGGGDETQPRGAVDLQRLLLDVSRLAASRRDLDGILAEHVMVLQKTFRFDGLTVVPHDPARREMVARFAGGAALVPERIVTSAGEGDAAALAWLTQQPIFVPDGSASSNLAPSAIEFRALADRRACLQTAIVRVLSAIL